MSESEPTTKEKPEDQTPPVLEMDGIVIDRGPDAETPLVEPTTPQAAAPETPVPDASLPAPDATPPSQEPTELDRIAATLAAVPEADRPVVYDALLGKLTPEDRVKVPAINELLQVAVSQAERRGQETGQRQAIQTDYDANIKAAQTELGDGATDEAMKSYRQAIEAKYHHDADNAAVLGNKNVLAIMGFKEIPDDVQRSLDAAATLEERLEVMGLAIANRAWQQGAAATKSTSAKESKANESVMYAQVLAKLQANERVTETTNADGSKTYTFKKDDMPPAMSGVDSVHGNSAFNPATYAEKLNKGEDVDPDQVDAMTRRYLSGVI